MTIETKMSSQDHAIVQHLKRQLKLKLCCLIVTTIIVAVIATGSSHQVQDGIDDVKSHPIALL
jgi:Ca2+/H+ antiporter